MTGKGISIQLYSILAKIAEVNDYLNPELQNRIFEVHPEVSFAKLNGSPMLSKKGEPKGFEERHKLLSGSFNDRIPDRSQASKVMPGMRVGADDTLDAVVAAWTAKHVVEGSASRLPTESEFGFRGLKAEIVY